LKEILENKLYIDVMTAFSKEDLKIIDRLTAFTKKLSNLV
jgi:hypothetical protein